MNNNKTKGISLNVQILIGTALGIAIGLIINTVGTDAIIPSGILYIADVAGSLFINLLKMILIPLVFTSISVGISNLQAHAQMSKIWKLALIYFLSTTAISITVGLIIVNIFKPGEGMEIALFKDAMTSLNIQSMALPVFIKTFIAGLFVNPIKAMAEAKILPTVLFALIFGIAVIISGEKAARVKLLLAELFDIIMLLVTWIMKLAPLGIMSLLIKLIASQDIGILSQLGVFIGVVLLGTLFHGIINLPVLLRIFTGIGPGRFFGAMNKAMLTAFSTSSSSATLPITMECVEENLEVDKDVGGFILPMGATVNMDGTALYEAMAALFIANIVGIDLNIIQQLVVFFMSIVAAIGAPGIPSAGMVTMVMVLQSVGLPAEGIAILLPIDRLLDAFRTTVNVEGDAVGCCIVNNFVKKYKD